MTYSSNHNAIMTSNNKRQHRHRFAKMYPGRIGGYADQGLVCKIEFDDNPPILDLALAHTVKGHGSTM
jgi:hypothetical protein